jgi:hypothetical protein
MALVGSGTGKPAGASGRTRTRTRDIPVPTVTGWTAGKQVETHGYTRGYARLQVVNYKIIITIVYFRAVGRDRLVFNMLGLLSRQRGRRRGGGIHFEPAGPFVKQWVRFRQVGSAFQMLGSYLR